MLFETSRGLAKDRREREAKAKPPALVDDRTTSEAVGSLLAPGMPLTPWERAEEEYGTGGAIMRRLGNLFTGGLFDDQIIPEYSTAGWDKYESDLELYNKQRELEVEGNYVDPQNEAIARDMEDPNSPNYNPFLANVIRQSGPEKLDLNNTTLSQGAKLVGFGGNTIAEGNPADDRSSAEKQFDRWLVENPNATPKERQTAYNTILRAGFSANGVRFDSFNGDEIGGDTDGTYAGIQSAASEGGSQGVQHKFDAFEGERNRYIAAWDEHDKFEERLARFDTALELFDPNRPGGAIDTGPLAGRIYSAMGIGDEGVATIANLGTRETIDMLSNFKGTTTDFEFSASELASFASIMKGEVANKETLEVARNALARQAKRNADAAEAAYKSMGDYAGDNVILKNSYETTGGNYKPWWEQGAESAQPATVSGDGEGVPMSEADALKWLAIPGNNTPENRRFFKETYGKTQ